MHYTVTKSLVMHAFKNSSGRTVVCKCADALRMFAIDIQCEHGSIVATQLTLPVVPTYGNEILYLFSSFVKVLLNSQKE